MVTLGAGGYLKRATKSGWQKDSGTGRGWLLFFYSVPSKPVSNRMKIWRMLAKAGALSLKGAIYVLPYSDDHYEFCQWLVSSVAVARGEAAFVRTDRIETMKDDEIIEMFNRQRAKDYLGLEKRLDELERKVGNIRKGAGAMSDRKIEEELNRFVKEFQQAGGIDFFFSDARKELEKRMKAITAEIAALSRAETGERAVEVVPRRAADYQGKIWVTRKRPFVDRMASAWLIRNFIDREATFGFIDESEIDGLDKDTVTFDIRGGEFTHVGDMSTFEVLLKAFCLKEKSLGVMAEIVHQVDLKDDKYSNPAAEGLRDILEGVRRTARDDHEALEKGTIIMEMLHASKS